MATKILKIKMPDYVFSFVICIFFGLAPFILCITGVTKILIPSVICIALSIISFITLVLYDGKELVFDIIKKISHIDKKMVLRKQHHFSDCRQIVRNVQYIIFYF